jgi:hypothetical protein
MPPRRVRLLILVLLSWMKETYRVSLPSQSASLGIGESNAMFTQTVFEESVLLLEVFDDLELLTNAVSSRSLRRVFDPL